MTKQRPKYIPALNEKTYQQIITLNKENKMAVYRIAHAQLNIRSLKIIFEC